MADLAPAAPAAPPPAKKSTRHTLLLQMAAGSGAGAATKTATAPLERIKIIFQVQVRRSLLSLRSVAARARSAPGRRRVRRRLGVTERVPAATGARRISGCGGQRARHAARVGATHAHAGACFITRSRRWCGAARCGSVRRRRAAAAPPPSQPRAARRPSRRAAALSPLPRTRRQRHAPRPPHPARSRCVRCGRSHSCIPPCLPRHPPPTAGHERGGPVQAQVHEHHADAVAGDQGGGAARAVEGQRRQRVARHPGVW